MTAGHAKSESRLAAYILEMAKTTGKERDEGTAVALPTEEEIGTPLSMPRETVAHTLDMLRRSGIIGHASFKGRGVLVFDLQALAMVAARA